MYINFWYPICKGEELNDDAPVRAQVLGLRFVAFRDSQGVAHVLSDTCIHRGGSLSKGKLHPDAVACPYHGWQFGGDGKCKLIPSLEDGAKPPPRAKVDSYPVEEKYGVVFAFLGDLAEAERPPLYEIPEWDNPDWRASECVLLEVNTYYERSVENGIDPLHNEFVHPVQGAPQPIPGTVNHSETEWGSGVHAYFHEKRPEGKVADAMESNKSELNSGTWHHGPNVIITHIHFDHTRGLHQYLFEAPVDRYHTRIFFINMRSFKLEPEFDDMIMQANLRVTEEDIGVLEEIYPVVTPDTTTSEVLVPGDRTVVRYREFLKDWESRGWRMDYSALENADPSVAFAIPSPGRRESGNWVVDAVPLMPKSSKSLDSAA